MRMPRVLTGMLVSLATVGFCLPPSLLAADRLPASVVVDVALQEGGVLMGQVVDPQGVPLKNVPVLLRNQKQEITVIKTGPDGYFSMRGLRGGTYQLTAARGHGVYRLWVPGTAPPAARHGALIVAGNDLARGQVGKVARGQYGGPKFWLANPWVIAGIVATAVAVPVAIHNAQDSTPASP